jgi:hypothetical protein
MGARTSRFLEGVKLATFSTFYVMLESTEEAKHPSVFVWLVAVFQLLIDAFQVFQNVISTASQNADVRNALPPSVSYIDPEKLVMSAFLGARAWVVFVLASVVVLTCFATAVWVSVRFWQQRVEKLWPVRPHLPC